MRDRLPARTARQPTDGTTIMMRPLLSAAVAGLLTAVPASLFLTAPARQDLHATLASPDNAVSGITSGAEAWPICSTMSAMVETPDWAALDPDYAAGKRAIGAGDWEGAIKALANAALRDDRNADIENYLGYAYRRLRQFDPAMEHYQRALTLNPRHRSAHEHLGEAHLAQGDLAKAKEHLAALEQVCLIPCDEYGDLKRAIAEYDKVANRKAR
jgi:tetratricopeptide (TPR) repeat protein